MQSRLRSSTLSKLHPKPNANVPKFPKSNGINIRVKHNPTGRISRVSILYIKHHTAHSSKYMAFSVTDFDTLEIAARGSQTDTNGLS